MVVVTVVVVVTVFHDVTLLELFKKQDLTAVKIKIAFLDAT